MEPWAETLPLGYCDLNTSDAHWAIEGKVLIWDGSIGGQWTVCGASLGLARCGVYVMKLLNGVVWNGGHTTKLVRLKSVPGNTPTYVNAVVPLPLRNVFPRRTPFALID